MRLILFTCAILMIAHNARAADLRIPLNAKIEREAPASPEERKRQLFEDFREWLRKHPLG
jgi:hypothetical protein